MTTNKIEEIRTIQDLVNALSWYPQDLPIWTHAKGESILLIEAKVWKEDNVNVEGIIIR